MKFENWEELQTHFRKDIRQSGKSDFRWSASACFPVFIQSGINYPPDIRWIWDKVLSQMICTPFTGQLVKGDFLCAIPMNSKNIALTCIGKGNIRKHLKAFPKGVFAWWSADGVEVWKYTVSKCWSIRNGTESGLRKNGSNWLTAFYPGNPLPPLLFPQEYALVD